MNRTIERTEAEEHEYQTLTESQRAAYHAAEDCGASHNDAMDAADGW